MSDYIARLVAQLAGQLREQEAVPCDRSTLLRQGTRRSGRVIPVWPPSCVKRRGWPNR